MRIAAISVVSSITGSFACAPGSCCHVYREGHFPTSLSRLPGLLFGALSGTGLHLPNKNLSDQLRSWTGESRSPFLSRYGVCHECGGVLSREEQFAQVIPRAR